MNLFEIERKKLEEQLQHLKIEELKNTLKNFTLSFAIETLSIDKNMDLLSKKADFDFLYQLFDSLNGLKKDTRTPKITITEDEIKKYMDDIMARGNDTFIPFIERAMDLSISKAKKHEMKDIKKVMKIAQKFNISDIKFITWVSKMTANSNNIKLLEEVAKSVIPHTKELKERFVTLILNKTDSIKLLDKLFSLYEPEIYNVYIENKYKNKIWNFLSLKHSNSGWGLPYVNEEKMKWFEDKKIGYKNHPVYFELYRVYSLYRIDFNYDREKVDTYLNDEYYQQIIAKSLQVYHDDFLPTRKKMIEENKEWYEIARWENSMPTYSILSLYENDKKFYEFCKSYGFKVVLEESLEPEEKETPKRKI